MAKSGSIRKATINSITFNVAADANASKTPTKQIEGVPHSGGNMIKETRLHGNVESLTLIVKDTEYETLESFRDSNDAFPMSYQKADGSTWTTQGFINLDNYETEENRVDVTMISESGIWDLFSV
jgi:hypothetical protein